MRLTTIAGLMATATACGDDLAEDPTLDGAADTGGSAATGSGDDGVEAVNYWHDIKPLLDGRCATCHTPDGIAPFPLMDYGDAASFVPGSMPSVLAKTMPPWPPSAECGEHSGHRDLTDAQIDLLAQWVDAGMPEGDPANEGPPMEPPTKGLTRVDQELAMPEPYRVNATPDDYRCFLIPWPEQYTDTAYVTGFAGLPGNEKTVHHIIAFLAGPDDVATYQEMDDAEEGPGYTCFGGTGGPSRTWIGAWAPGGLGEDLPEGLGLPVEPGSAIVLQVHYNALTKDEAPDLSSIQLKIDERVDKEAYVIPFANPAWLLGGMPIPAGERDVMHEFSADIVDFVGSDLMLYSAGLHMHLLGKSAQLSIERASGPDECMLRIDDWDFSWQGSYRFADPLPLTAGDKVHIECHYDNSAENQPLIDGKQGEPQDASWGEGTTDEMCLGVMLATAK